MELAIGIALAVIVLIVVIYNALVRSRNRVEEAWSQIDVQLQRRHELIPNLVETVKGYASHEQQIFDAVTQARAAAMRADAPGQLADAEQALEAATAQLMAVAEAYPELKASANFLELQRELSSTEDRVAYSRQYYNSSVQRYDTKRQTVPFNIFAGLFNFEDREYYEVTDAAARVAPQIDMSRTTAEPTDNA